ncbi:MAG: hypothetical protein MR654_11375 [Corynebacterium glucuronolyticum]|nr:hypothetical protein [Corynebacterium glucuronolyticum]
MNKKEITRVHYTIHTHHTTTPQNQKKKKPFSPSALRNSDQKEQHTLPQTPNSMPMHHKMKKRLTKPSKSTMTICRFCLHAGLKKDAVTHTATPTPQTPNNHKR